MKYLVVGCGSIGERHIRNLLSLSVGEILLHDSDARRLELIGEKYHLKTFAELDQALAHPVDAFLICVPPSLHIALARIGVEHGAHLFIEKPLSNTLSGVDAVLSEAKAKGLTVLVGYNWRFHPALKLLKQFMNEGTIGRVLSARVDLGQYLPDWHPWQDYRQMYTAKKDMGGGIILDGSHELDYIRWLMGEVREVSCFAGKLSNLDVDTEDIAEILLRFDRDTLANVHLDFVQRVYSRSCKLIGEEGTIIWDYAGGKVGVFTAKSGRWEETRVEADPNEMYVEEMKHFIRCVQGEEMPLIDGIEGKKALEIALAAKTSSYSGGAVQLR